MSRIPPGLLYLTIYNPTLRPAELIDSEDAEEQSHILFYTARERAVSRDKILRQVGLAKALISFSSMFNGNSVCENVHSQSRRMIMVSPEPNFWMHACLELAKTPRPVVTKAKDKGKGKKKETILKSEIVYDYHDGSLHDLALRKHILRGYELFKLTHGSFSSILNSLGQQALELQLERFFTVWAWKWDPEEDMDFAKHLGFPLYPQHKSLTPILDSFISQLHFDTAAFALLPPHLIPSTKLLKSKIPACLPELVLSRIPPAPPPVQVSDQAPAVSTEEPSNDTDGKMPPSPAQRDEKPPDTAKPGTAFLNMGSMGLNVDLRNIKWGWPGYLTLSRSTTPQSSLTPSESATPLKEESNVANAATEDDDKLQVKPPEIDTESLKEAINTDYIHSPQIPQQGLPSPSHSSVLDGPLGNPPSPPHESEDASSALAVDDGGEKREDTDPHQTADNSQTADKEKGSPSFHDYEPESATTDTPTSSEVEKTHIEEPLPTFTWTAIHLAEDDDPYATKRKKVLHLTKHPLTLALIVDIDHDPSDGSLVKLYLETLKKLEQAMTAEQNRSPDASLPTVNTILEGQDRYVICTGQYTITSSRGFDSRSEHLYNGQQALQSEHDVVEVFSRGQNPQHWQLSRRGLGIDKKGQPADGEVYMEIGRKESSLIDVDNELAGVIRKFLEQ